MNVFDYLDLKFWHICFSNLMMVHVALKRSLIIFTFIVKCTSYLLILKLFCFLFLADRSFYPACHTRHFEVVCRQTDISFSVFFPSDCTVTWHINFLAKHSSSSASGHSVFFWANYIFSRFLVLMPILVFFCCCRQ